MLGARVVIVGAGPAGSTAAILLARAGIGVTLIEQHRFPRDKVCGECLSALGLDVLGRLRLSAAAHRFQPSRLNRTILFSGDGTATDIDLPRPMMGISRCVFDELLLTTAREAGARVLQPARCESVGPPLVVRMLETNELRRVEAEYVLVADGKGRCRTGDFGLKAHFTNLGASPDAIALFGVRGHYGGVAPIEGERWNIALSVPGARLRASRGELDRMFSEIVSENRALSQQMRRASRVSDWLVSPLPRFGVHNHWPAGVIPIGNAAAALEPIGGEGIGLAMRSAEIAAQHVISAVASGGLPDVQRLQREYRQLWNLRRFACRAMALAVSSPRFWGFIDAQTPLTELALRAMGKGA